MARNIVNSTRCLTNTNTTSLGDELIGQGSQSLPVIETQQEKKANTTKSQEQDADTLNENKLLEVAIVFLEANNSIDHISLHKNEVKMTLARKNLGRENLATNIIKFTRSLNKAIIKSLMDEMVEQSKLSSTSENARLQKQNRKARIYQIQKKTRDISCGKENYLKDVVEHVFESLDAESEKFVISFHEDNVIEKSADTSSRESVGTHFAMALLA